MYRKTAPLLIIIFAALAFAAPASAHSPSLREYAAHSNDRELRAVAAGSTEDPFETAPKVTAAELPGLPLWQETAVAYWARVASVRSLPTACPEGIDYRIMPGVPEAGGWGRKRFVKSDGTVVPCMTWFEQDDLRWARHAGGEWWMNRVACLVEAHEMGHMLDVGTPTDDDHKFTGDPNLVMTPDGTETPDCVAAFPKPPAPKVKPRPRRCFPAWAFYSTTHVRTLYGRSFRKHAARSVQRAKARRAYRSWRVTHRARAARISKRARRCV